MNICFACGSKLKLIAKPGRLIWDDQDDNDLLWEIPQEIKIPVCIDCGFILEEPFWKKKVTRSIESQKKVKPSTRLAQLRWIDQTLEGLLENPETYALTLDGLFARIILSLQFREIAMSKGLSDQSQRVISSCEKFILHRHPQYSDIKALLSSKMPLDEFADIMEMFCDVWIWTA